MKEKAFENKVKAFLKKDGCYFVKYFGCAFTQAGVPDLLCCVGGRFVAVELKSENGKPSNLQIYNIEEIKKSGGIAFVLYPQNFEEFKTVIRKLKNDYLQSLKS